jgi:hypothetical protein
MLIISIVGSLVLLAFANLFAFLSKRPGHWIVGLCLVFLIVAFFLGMIIPPVGWLSASLLVGLMIWKLTSCGPRLLLGLSIASLLLAFAIPTVEGFRAERGFAVLRARYPFESMEGRVPPPKPGSRNPLVLAARRSEQDEQDESDRPWNIRSRRLRNLHEDAVGLFVRSYGFGVGRFMSPVPTESNLRDETERVVLPQPGRRIALGGSPGEWGKPSFDISDRLVQLHEGSLFDFVDLWTSGYIKDRAHVAGFVSHQFREVPDSSPLLKLQTLDLVGLLLHEQPIAYVTSNLPSMDELRQAPTRPLDRFETVGLATLQGGDDLWSVSDGGTIRMLGAVRSRKQCVVCHAGESGDLLGAFSYTFTQKE